MLIKNIIVSAVLLFSLLGLPTKDEAIELEIPNTPQEYIEYYAKIYNTDPNVLLSVAKCESEFNQNNIGDGNRAVGLFQFHQETWNRMSKLLGEKLDRNSVKDQARLSAFIFANYPEMRKEWSTYRAIEKGGTYSFYSTLLQKHYTVKCSLIYR